MGFVGQSNASPGTIAVGRVGTVGKVHLLSVPSWASDNTIVVNPTDGVDSRWLAYSIVAAEEFGDMLSGFADDSS